ncbi:MULTISPECIES: NEL-type E3 ubiquitin ligase domain-containing protein [unclassified Pseudomonas]|uniref:NEL-type E3 ubiquitin ligase domain-containing protein n=1 Tax=unclassified Pseudomonas TaxID=196821 RepID=UPI001482525B|nr:MULTISPECIES: NEL-type E3 ubiquitin ligase domain-containing protein [unclassified Pseudomonas]
MSDIPAASPSLDAVAPPGPVVTQSLHADLLQQSSPGWLINASPRQREALKHADSATPDWYRHASRDQRKTVGDALTASFVAQANLDKAMSGFQDIDQFAAPLLTKALKDRFNVTLDVNKTWLVLNKPVEMGIFSIEIDYFEVLKQPLLQAALHNFEARECESGAFHRTSGFRLETSTAGTLEPLNTRLTVEQFTGLCRSLDIGAKYQAYLKDFLHPKDAVAVHVLRDKFIDAYKTALRAAAELALVKGDIGREDYASIRSVLNGELAPRQGHRQIWFRDLGLMGRRMTGCVLFTICEKYRYSDDSILYIPGDPFHPLKRYKGREIEAMFKQRFTTRDASRAHPAKPNAYQRFFSQFVAYGDRPYFFSQFTNDTPDRTFAQKLEPYAPQFNEIYKALNPINGALTGIRELPPVSPVAQVPNADPYLNPVDLSRKGHGIWADNVDLWNYLFDQHRDRLIADARSHAVPTADVDARVRSEKLAVLLNIGMLVLTGISMFVPVLGEVMMVVMTGQLLEETFEGSIEWSEGDRKAAKAHLIDVAQNLALIALMAGAGKGLARLTAARSTPVIENLHQVQMPDGRTRLWKPDLNGYESPVTLDSRAAPNALGQYRVGQDHYIRLEGKTYRQTYDESLKAWRIDHPNDPQAYQPPLAHNGAGAWRHTLERPQAWDRLTLLRRIGHSNDVFANEQLLALADTAGVSDGALRKMHLDNALPPPELAEAMRLFNAERDAGLIVEQIAGRQPIDGRYLQVLPLLPEMPRWPWGRQLKIYDSSDFSGTALRYGTRRGGKAPIRVSRAEVLNGELPARILASLDETEVVRLLGGEPARVAAIRPQELARQIGDFTETRKPALFQGLLRTGDPVAPRVAKLQRIQPGLTERAAQAVLRQADAEELARLDSSSRVPLHLQEIGRWYAGEGRLTRAIAGLRSDTMASTDSARLALHTLSRLPGWPDDVRLELREGSVGGPLIDGIGNETASHRKFVVRNGTSWQAFNDRAETLNSMPARGGNFYTSLMHALPDEARRSIGLPQVGQSGELQRAIIDYAGAHRSDCTRVFQSASSAGLRFRPPRRIASGLLGYPASGDGPGPDPVLTGHVQNVYPRLSDAQARGFILEQWRLGKTDQQIFHLLNNRMSEWRELEATLDRWLAGQDTRFHIAEDEFRRCVQGIKDSWRNAPLAEHDPQAASLTIVSGTRLPSLSADFSHVRELTLRAPAVADTLAAFPNVERLALSASIAEFDKVLTTLRSLRHMTRLKLSTPVTAKVAARLRELIRLEELELHCTGGGMHPVVPTTLDVSGMRRLRRLEVASPAMYQWPLGVLDLPRLERLNLRSTAINSLPVEIYEGHQRLLSGLSLDWSKFPRRVFKPIYEFIRSQPRHLVDLEEMVADYCRGELKRFVGMEPSLFDVLSNGFKAQFTDSTSRLAAIETLGEQFGELNRLQEWVGPGPTVFNGGAARSAVVEALKNNWRGGLFQRFGAPTESVFFNLYVSLPNDASVLEILGSPMDSLPTLSAEGFSHVRSLHLAGLEAPLEHMRGFIRTFRGIDTLDLSHCNLSALPLEPGNLPALETLNLHDNPLNRIDLRGMNRLKALDLSKTAIDQWPVGAEALPELTWLDLSDSRLTTLPDALLAGDRLLLDTSLTGTPLSPQAQAGLAVARRRIEDSRGLIAGSLQRFALEEPRHRTPPTESGSVIARRLLPLPPVPVDEGPLTWGARVQRLRPDYDAARAQTAIERMQDAGLAETQISARIVNWEQSFESLTRRLNDWLFTHETRGMDWVVSSRSRQLAAQRIIQCWREGAIDWSGVTDRELSLDGLQVGNLPELDDVMPAVSSLNLSGVKLTTNGSSGFLKAFTQLRRLSLSGNQLSAIPDPVAQMRQLERLELSFTGLVQSTTLYPLLEGLEQLRWLDLSHNSLRTFDITRLGRLERLNLQDNLLTAWPDGALQSPNLQTLDLSNNEIASIPSELYDGTHGALIAGSNLSENYEISQQSLVRLRAYADAHGRHDALGMTYADIDRMIDDLDSTTESDDEGAGPESEPEMDEVLSTLTESALEQQVTPWIENIAHEDVVSHRAMWNRLAAEPDNAAFFHLLSRMPDTEEFRVFRADLTRRVWDIIKAADGSHELRETLFSMASTHTTCVDGRTLALSEIEVKVFEYNALQHLQPGLADKGRALLDLSRQLFRLGEVEKLAARSMSRHADPAEVRLQYRIGLTSGWEDGLQLPGQPSHMRFARPIRGDELAAARAAVVKAEKSERFYEDLISREYWVQYLNEKYPEAFAALGRDADEQLERLENEHEDVSSAAYREAVQMLEVERSVGRNLKLIELSHLETGEPMSSGTGGTSRDLMDTSTG